MHGVYCAYAPAAPPPPSEPGSATVAHPSLIPAHASPSHSPSHAEPAVVVLTPPYQGSATAAAGALSGVPATPRSTPRIDVDLLQLLYIAYPTAFFVVVTEPLAADAQGGSGSGNRDRTAASLHDAAVHAFFQQPTVQQRTCRLTLATAATPVASFTSPSFDGAERHMLHLSPVAAAQVMQRQPWLKELHECARRLCTVAEVAAAVLLAGTGVLAAPSAPCAFRMATATVLELVARCEWVGDTELAALLLSCVARAACGGRRIGTAPRMPRWIGGHDGDEDHLDEVDTVRGAGLRVPEAYCTHTSSEATAAAALPATATTTNTVGVLPPALTAPGASVNVMGGCVSVALNHSTSRAGSSGADDRRSATGLRSSAARGTAADASASTEMHLLVCTALTGGDGDPAGQAAAAVTAGDVVTSLLRRLQRKARLQRGRRRDSDEADVAYTVHLSLNGHDALSSRSDAIHVGQATGGLASGSLEDALALASLESPLPARTASPAVGGVDRGSDGGAGEGLMACVLAQVRATLRQLHDAAHVARLAGAVAGAAVGHQQEPPLEPHRATARRPATIISAAVVLCVDDHCLGHWAERGYPPFTTLQASPPVAPLSPLLHDTPLYLCLQPSPPDRSGGATAAAVQRRLCQTPWILDGLRTAYILCTRTHGAVFVHEGGEAAAPPRPLDEARAYAAARPRTGALARHLANRLHGWAAAVFRNVHVCVFSELQHRDGGRQGHHRRHRGDSAAASDAAVAQHLDVPQCSLCAPGPSAQRWAPDVHVRLWRCAAATCLSARTPTAPFLLYEVLAAAATRSHGRAPPPQQQQQAWAEELVSQHVFAFARCAPPVNLRSGAPTWWAASAVARVQPRISLFKPGPLLQWYSRQYTLHVTLSALAVVLEAQVERVKSLFFVLAANEGGRLAKQGMGSAEAREALAEAVLDALRRVTVTLARLQRHDTAVVATLAHLLPFESVDERLPTASTTNAGGQVPAPASRVLPAAVRSVVDEVGVAWHRLQHERQQQSHVLGEPIAPSAADTAAAVEQLLQLLFLKARVHHVHATCAAVVEGSDDDDEDSEHECEAAPRDAAREEGAPPMQAPEQPVVVTRNGAEPQAADSGATEPGLQNVQQPPGDTTASRLDVVSAAADTDSPEDAAVLLPEDGSCEDVVVDVELPPLPLPPPPPQRITEAEPLSSLAPPADAAADPAVESQGTVEVRLNTSARDASEHPSLASPSEQAGTRLHTASPTASASAPAVVLPAETTLDVVRRPDQGEAEPPVYLRARPASEQQQQPHRPLSVSVGHDESGESPVFDVRLPSVEDEAGVDNPVALLGPAARASRANLDVHTAPVAVPAVRESAHPAVHLRTAAAARATAFGSGNVITAAELPLAVHVHTRFNPRTHVDVTTHDGGLASGQHRTPPEVELTGHQGRSATADTPSPPDSAVPLVEEAAMAQTPSRSLRQQSQESDTPTRPLSPPLTPDASRESSVDAAQGAHDHDAEEGSSATPKNTTTPAPPRVDSPPAHPYNCRRTSPASVSSDAAAAACGDSPDTDTVRARARLPTPPPPPRCGTAKRDTVSVAPGSEGAAAYNTGTPGQGTPPPHPSAPPPPLDWRWSSLAPPSNTGSGTTAASAVSSVAALLATHLPRPATATALTPAPVLPSGNGLLRVARYAAGQLTMEVLDATSAAQAALPRADTPAAAREQPVAHLALLHVDMTAGSGGALRVLEVLPCVIAPTCAAAPRDTAEAAAAPHSRYTFLAPVPPSAAVAVVYLGLRRPATQWVSAADVLWLGGVAFAVERPALESASASNVQADGLTVHWAPSATRVQVRVTELAAPPATHTHTALPTGTVGASGVEEDGRRAVQVRLRSPTVITGLREGCVYLLQLTPLPGGRRTVTLLSPTQAHPRQQQQQQQVCVQLDIIVDAAVRPRAVLAVTGLAPSIHHLQVQQLCAVPSSGVSNTSADSRSVAAAASAAPPLPHVAGRVVCPLFHYVTAAFPAALLRHCALFPDDDAEGATPSTSAAVRGAQLVRLNVSIVPVLAAEAACPSRAAGTSQAARPPAHKDATVVTGGRDGDAEQPAAPSLLLQLTALEDALVLPDVSAQGGLRRYAFVVPAGVEVGASLSLRIHLSAETAPWTSPTPAAATAATYVPVFHDVQRDVLSALLGPFHVCTRTRLRIHTDVDADEVELMWEGTDADYAVRVCRRGGTTTCIEDVSEAAAPAARASSPAAGDRVEDPADLCNTTAAVDAHPVRSKVHRTEGGVEGVYHITGSLSPEAGAAASVSFADHAPASGSDSAEAPRRTTPLYHAVLRLGNLQPAAEYVAYIACARNHVGDAVQAVWRTRPPVPSTQLCRAAFDSRTRQLHLRFLLGSRDDMRHQQQPRLYFDAVVRPLNTSVQVPAEGAVVVQRVLDCSVVPPGEPIVVELRRRAVWESCGAGDDSGGVTAAVAASLRSGAVVYCVVSELQVCVVQAQSDSQLPQLELRWTSAGSGVVPGLSGAAVAAVVLNGVCRVPVTAAIAGPQQRVTLTLEHLRAATTGAPAAHEAQLAESEEATWWKGVVAATDFEAASARVVPVTDRCRTLLLPPPPPPPRSALTLHNYEDAADIFVDVAAVYALYHDEHLHLQRVPPVVRDGDGEGNTEVARGPPTTPPSASLAAALRRRVQLALAVRGASAAVAGNATLVPVPTSLHPLDRSTAPASGSGGATQCVRVPLPAYRPYDFHLRLALHVRCDETGTSASTTAAEDAVAGSLHLLVPQPSSLRSVDLPVPPAEPILDVVVSAITARDAVVDWTPPLSLLRHLRRQPDMTVSYEVRLYPARRVAQETADVLLSEPPPLPPPPELAATVCVTQEPHACLTALAPATPYVVVVRGTGFGDYYATAGFVTAPVVADAVVARVRESLAVEAVVATPLMAGAAAVAAPAHTLRSREPTAMQPPPPRRPSRPGASPAPPRRTPALWAVLPASDVVTWRPDPATAGAPSHADITVATHYTAALVAPTRELLRQWQSAAGTATTLYHEWDGVEWPHLEVMAHTDVVLLKEEEQEDGEAARCPVAYAVASAHQSGVRHRTRVDLVGTPQLMHPRRSHGAEPPPTACTVRWGGSSEAGYDVSWCLTFDPRHVHHTHVPATAPVCAFTVPLDSLSNSAAAGSSNAVAAGPVCAAVCITSRRGWVEAAAHPRHPLRCGGGLASAGVRRVRDGGSNTVCAAWLLPPPLQLWAPSPTPVVYRTAGLATVLLPPSTGGEAGDGLDTRGDGKDSGGAVVGDGLRDLLSRRYTLVAGTRKDRATPDGDGGTAQGEGDEAVRGAVHAAARSSVTAWTAAQHRQLRLDAARDGLLVDVRTPADGAALEVELRCVDAVLQPHAAVWQQQLSAHLVQRHTQHFAPSVSGAAAAAQAPVVPLRWLQVVAEARRPQCIPAVCALSHLSIAALDDAGCVEVPPLAMSLSAPTTRHALPGHRRNSSRGKHAQRGRGGQHAARPSRDGDAVEAVPAPAGAAWLPLTSAAAAPDRARSDASAAPPDSPRCLERFTGTLGDGGSGDGARVDDAAAAATLAELSRLQDWTARGHPTLRVRLTWTSSDDAFVVRVAGPYSGVAEVHTGVDAAGVVAGEDGRATHEAASSASPSPALLLPRAVRAALCADDFPSVAAMPHQRTYTCRPVAGHGEGHGGGAAAAPTDALVLEPDGTVHTASAAATAHKHAAAAAVLDGGVMDTRTCHTYGVEVDGLLPEALYRVQVTGLRCGDVRLRLQFLTPPSALTQLLTVGEGAAAPAAADSANGEAQDSSAESATLRGGFPSRATPSLSPRQQLRLHVRHYNPHAYGVDSSQASGVGGGGHRGEAGAHANMLAPGLRYCTRSYLELRSVTTGKRLVRCLTHTCGSASAFHPTSTSAAHEEVASDADGVPCAIAEALITVDVEDAVRVVAVHEMCALGEGGCEGLSAPPFLHAALWGPLLGRCTAAGDDGAGAVQEGHGAYVFAPLRLDSAKPLCESSESNSGADVAPLQKTCVLLCDVPRLPRLERLAVRRCALQSLQLSWRWWPGSAHCGSRSAGLEGGNARSMLLVHYASLGSTDATSPAASSSSVSTAVTAVCASPLVTLSGLQPSTLYEIQINEVPIEQVADARALAARRRSLAAADVKAEPAKEWGLHDLYAITAAKLPPSTAAAVRALAQTSSRPASLVLVQPQQQTRTGVLRGGISVGGSGSSGASRGAVTCYALTPPATYLISGAVPRPPMAQRVRRRPGTLTIALPCADATALTAHASHVHRQAGLIQLSYAAVLVLPERVCYVPAGAEQELGRWWQLSPSPAAARPTTDALCDRTTADMRRWWATRIAATLKHGWWHTLASAETSRTAAAAVAEASGVGQATPASYTSGGTAGAPLEVLHWSAELAWRVLGVSARPGATPPPLRVAPVDVRRVQDKAGGGSTGGARCWWHYAIPITEPPYDPPSSAGSRLDEAAEGPDAATPPSVSRVAYVVQVEDLLPLPPSQMPLLGAPQPASEGGGALVGSAQHLTVGQAPLSVKRLRLVRDLRVRGTVTVATDTAPTATTQAPPASAATAMSVTASLRVHWTWPTWSHHEATVQAAAPTDALPRGLSSNALSRCAARVSCAPLPALDATAEAVEAVFVRHIQDGAHAVDVAGLAPATLYRLRLTDVRLLGDGEGGGHAKPALAVRGEDVSVIALTPPAPLAAHELPVLRYRLLGSKAAAAAAAAAVGSEIRVVPRGLEVHFQLPAAQRQSQGLLSVPHAVLINLDAIDLDVCRTSEDLLAAALHERVAPHLRANTHACSTPSGASAVATAAAAAVAGGGSARPALTAEPPVVYHNACTQQRLRVTVTLRRPMQQRYAVAFFCAVRPRSGMDVAVPLSEAVQDAEAGDPMAAAAAAAGPLLSAPTVVPMRYPASVLAAYGCGAASSAAAAIGSRRPAPAASSARRLVCRPTRLHVHDRTRDRLVLRWALDLPALRLSEAERLRLLRRGAFVVTVAAAVAAGETGEAGRSTPGTAEHAPPAERLVFYRCNTAVASPPLVAPPSEAPVVHGAPAAVRALAFAPRSVRVGDYLILSETSDEAAGASTRGDDAQAAAAAVATQPSCLTYELVLPCATYTASHAAYTVTVALSPEWAAEEAEDAKSQAGHARVTASAADTSPCSSAHRSSRYRPRSEPGPTPTPRPPQQQQPSVELTSQSILVPAVYPPLPVQRVCVVHCTDTTCTVEWRAAEVEQRRPHACVVEWEAQQVSQGNSDGDARDGASTTASGQQWVKAGPQVPNRLTLKGLSPHTSYTVRVVPHNAYGEPCEDSCNATVTVHTL